MKNAVAFVLVVVVAAAWFSVGQVMDTKTVTPLFNYFITPVLTLAAAFGGSWYAFKLQDDKSMREANARNVKAANSAIFELSRSYNKLLAVRRQFVDEHINNQWRHILIMPIAGMTWRAPEFDYDALSFLFRSPNPNLLGTLSLVEQEIASTLDIIQQRSKLHAEHLQTAVEQVEKSHGPAFDPALVEQALGPRQTQVIRSLTDYMISGLDDALAGIQEHIELLEKETKALYPDHIVVGMTPPSSEISKQQRRSG